MQTDKFRKIKSLFSTTLSSGISTGTGETITLNSASGLPTDTEITLTFDRVDANGTATPAKMERITGTISGSNLTSYTRAVEGTEQAHSAGAVVEIIWDGDTWNDAVDGILVEHGQDGTHDNTTVALLAGAQTFTGSKTFNEDINVASGKNVIQAGSDPWRTITLMPGFLKPTTTNGCASSATSEAVTNDIDYDTLDFDASSDESAFANFQMPESWDGGSIQFRPIWTNAGGGAAETVDWALKGRSFADDDAIDQANGTSVTVTDTWIAQGDVHTSAWSDDVTLAGTPAAGELVHIEIFRDTSEDDLTGDAKLIALQIRYKAATYSD